MSQLHSRYCLVFEDGGRRGQHCISSVVMVATQARSVAAATAMMAVARMAGVAVVLAVPEMD